MRLWYISHRRSFGIRDCSILKIVWASSWDYGTYRIGDQRRLRRAAHPGSLSRAFAIAHMNYGSRRRVRPKIRHLAPLDGCACVFEEWIYGGQKMPKSHELARIRDWNIFWYLQNPLVSKDCKILWYLGTVESSSIRGLENLLVSGLPHPLVSADCELLWYQGTAESSGIGDCRILLEQGLLNPLV